MNENNQIIHADLVIRYYVSYKDLQEKMTDLRGRSCDGSAEDLEADLLSAQENFETSLEEYLYLYPKSEDVW